MPLKSVKFLLQQQPSGDLASRRQHARRMTPYPTQMQALIDAQLMTADCYEQHRDRRGMEQDARDDEVLRLLEDDRPSVLCQIFQELKRLVGCL
ncbi:MAG: hypothetical protein EOO38_00155 [Cytophagaceae bacterium]|nr:MAG: hypothetical protein EOO38_00155 [Cytophagaceae bacterium]